ncbi:hypothetical protein QJQ45_005910 [Haematococcus lacustris]|nr:hypothetical protein QJQ45_005910 [Haematococcus lacustris]
MVRVSGSGPGPHGPMSPRGPRREGQRAQPGSRRPPGELPREPSIMQEMAIHKRMIGRIIGPGGEIAANLRRTTRCGLHVRKEVNRQDDTQIVEVSGNAQQLKEGVNRVLELLRVDTDKDYTPRMPPHATTFFDVLPEMVGYVLGARGVTVKAIKEKTKTQIQISDVHPETGLQAITIRGNPSAIQEAYTTIVVMLDRFDPRRTRPPPTGLGQNHGEGGGPGGAGLPPHMTQSGHPGGVGGLLGALNGHLMSQQHGAMMHFPGPGYPGGGLGGGGGLSGGFGPGHMGYEGFDPGMGNGEFGPGPEGYGPGHEGADADWLRGLEGGRPRQGLGGPEGYGLHGPGAMGFGGGRGAAGREVGQEDRYGGRGLDMRSNPLPLGGLAGGSGAAAVPQLLVLHPDGTYRPAQLVLNPGAGGAAVMAMDGTGQHHSLLQSLTSQGLGQQSTQTQGAGQGMAAPGQPGQQPDFGSAATAAAVAAAAAAPGGLGALNISSQLLANVQQALMLHQQQQQLQQQQQPQQQQAQQQQQLQGPIPSTMQAAGQLLSQLASPLQQLSAAASGGAQQQQQQQQQPQPQQPFPQTLTAPQAQPLHPPQLPLQQQPVAPPGYGPAASAAAAAAPPYAHYPAQYLQPYQQQQPSADAAAYYAHYYQQMAPQQQQQQQQQPAGQPGLAAPFPHPQQQQQQQGAPGPTPGTQATAAPAAAPAASAPAAGQATTPLATAPAAAAQAGPTMSMAQLQQYYSAYSQLYQQAAGAAQASQQASQQPQQQQAGGGGGGSS